jgi:hypothetical protein
VATSGDFTLLEDDETSTERRNSVEEARANRFAALVLTGGRLQELTDRVVQGAGGDVRRLKAHVERVASEAELPVGLLANLLAQRLAEDPANPTWWPTAASLQRDTDDPWKVVRDAFVRYANFDGLDGPERAILRQIMETTDE